MYSDYENPLRIGLWCLLLTSAWHLFVGVSGLIFAPRGGYTPALLVLFILSGLLGFILLGEILFNLRPAHHLYAATTALMLAFLLAYADVHVFGVLERVSPVTLTAGGTKGATFDLSLVWHHLYTDPAALVSKAVEAAAAVIFGVYTATTWR